VVCGLTLQYADWILNLIDRKSSISHRFYRRHTVPDGMNFVKDLSRIGRSLERMIIVDNVAENFQLQPDNGIFIKSWYSDPNDTALVELAPLLKGRASALIHRNRQAEDSGCAKCAEDLQDEDVGEL
jgi:TFIIF-interacting CTD phosphatase-like protein